MSTANGPVAAAIAGVFTHMLYFKKGEHHLYGLRYVELFLFSLVATATLNRSYLADADAVPQGWGEALAHSGKLHACYLGGIYAGLVVYRLFFHPLRHFPGPLDLKISALSLTYRVRHLDCHKRVQELHSQYGPFLRIGPSAISVIHPSAIKLIHSADSGFTKGDFYDLLYPAKSLQMVRSKSEHASRRRVWSAAFSDKALRGYEKRTLVYQDKLLSKIAATNSQPTNLTKWVHAYNFDVTSDLTFGKAFGALDSDDNYWMVDMWEKGLDVLGLMLPAWVFRLMSDIPGLNSDFLKVVSFTRGKMIDRMKNKPDIPDMASALLSAWEGREPTKEEMNLLTGDSHLIIGAGSDTSSTTMAVIMYFLTRYPEEMTKLRNELLPLMITPPGLGVSFRSEKLASLNHLNGVINEALRLYPIIPSATYRMTPPQGVSIAGTFIPGNTNVWTPQYTIGRSEEIYEEPNRFFPERWYKYPEMVKDPSAFAPFLIGPASCIGKPLALQNVRSTIAKLVCTFDISLPPGDDGSGFEKGIKDRWPLGVPELMLTFTKREPGI